MLATIFRGLVIQTAVSNLEGGSSPAVPLPHDEKLIALSNDVLQQFQTIFGQHPGFRPAPHQGHPVDWNFPLLSQARNALPGLLTSVVPPHKYSSATGLPVIPDDPNANPRGMATRFYLAGERVH